MTILLLFAMHRTPDIWVCLESSRQALSFQLHTHKLSRRSKSQCRLQGGRAISNHSKFGSAKVCDTFFRAEDELNLRATRVSLRKKTCTQIALIHRHLYPVWPNNAQFFSRKPCRRTQNTTKKSVV